MSPYPTNVKVRALQRMGAAIERAIVSKLPRDKDRAARWAGAWGLLCEIERVPQARAWALNDDSESDDGAGLA
ncbi:hypothetical protein [Massilia violaceinigra]|uniref:hypothetical protein n=1 Tax=Massilia violaceinigra TaxID=2045208 RepID=UPI0012FD55D5|nr:hypothetical protein [Massilia violaceinigra]